MSDKILVCALVDDNSDEAPGLVETMAINTGFNGEMDLGYSHSIFYKPGLFDDIAKEKAFDAKLLEINAEAARKIEEAAKAMFGDDVKTLDEMKGFTLVGLQAAAAAAGTEVDPETVAYLSKPSLEVVTEDA